MVAGAGAVSMGAAAAWAFSDVLAAALCDWGVGAPGDAILGFFLPFALVSVYARFILGLYLAKRLGGRPERNRLLGAAAGVVWMMLAAGLVARLSGIPDARGFNMDAQDSQDSFGRSHPVHPVHPCQVPFAGAPFTSWLARYPGRIGGWVYSCAANEDLQDRQDESCSSCASLLKPLPDGPKDASHGRSPAPFPCAILRDALDGARAQGRASRADEAAAARLREGTLVPLRLGAEER
jgi:hypothetical protein